MNNIQDADGTRRQYYLEYEPVFLLDHLGFGSKFRQFKTGSLEILLRQNEIAEASEEMKFITLALHMEEMASYEDLGSLLYATKEKFENGVPLLQSLLTYDNSSAILSKLLSQHNAASLIQNFHLDKLICEETLPPVKDLDAANISKKVSEIITIDFKKNTKLERVDAYYRMKHGSVLISSAIPYAGTKYGHNNPDLPGVLLKSNTLDPKKKKIIPSEIENSPFVPFGFPIGATFRENTFKAVDVSTRIQQLLCIVLLLKFHADFLAKRSLDKRTLYQKELELEKLCGELSKG